MQRKDATRILLAAVSSRRLCCSALPLRRRRPSRCLALSSRFPNPSHHPWIKLALCSLPISLERSFQLFSVRRHAQSCLVSAMNATSCETYPILWRSPDRAPSQTRLHAPCRSSTRSIPYASLFVSLVPSTGIGSSSSRPKAAGSVAGEVG